MMKICNHIEQPADLIRICADTHKKLGCAGKERGDIQRPARNSEFYGVSFPLNLFLC